MEKKQRQKNANKYKTADTHTALTRNEMVLLNIPRIQIYDNKPTTVQYISDKRLCDDRENVLRKKQLNNDKR